MSNGWKQATPTDGQTNPNLREGDWMIFCYIWNFVRKEDGVVHFTQAGRHYSVKLKRGQCIFKVRTIADFFKVDWKFVRRSVDFLSKWYTPMEIQGKPYGLLLTFKDYDNLIKMEKQMENSGRIEGEQVENRRRTNKNVKNVKNNIRGVAEQLISYWNEEYGRKFRVPRKGGWLKNFESWLETYTLEEIKQAVGVAQTKHKFYKDKITPDMLFRTHEDRIGGMLNYQTDRDSLVPKDLL